MPVLDAFGSPELSILLRLARRPPNERVTMRALQEACAGLGYSPSTLRKACLLLGEVGLLEDKRTPRGATEIAAIGLTDVGREAGARFLAVEALVRGGSRPRRRRREGRAGA